MDEKFPFYSSMPDEKTLVVDTGNRDFPFPELVKHQGSSKLMLSICKPDESDICLSIAFGYGFLYKKADKDKCLATLLSIYPLKLDSGEYGITEKKSGEWARFFPYVKINYFLLS